MTFFKNKFFRILKTKTVKFYNILCDDFFYANSLSIAPAMTRR